MTDFGRCPICGGKLTRWRDGEIGITHEAEESCPHCELYLFEFHYGHSEQRYGWLFQAWSYIEESPKDWREHRDEAKAICRSETGHALFREVRKSGCPTLKLVFADWCQENGLPIHEQRLREEAAMWRVPTRSSSPPCRVCGKREPVLVYPDTRHQTICPDCCDKAEHADGETGHVWEYDQWERDRVCIHCGIRRRCTEYAFDD